MRIKKGVEATITANNIHITNSYLITNEKEMTNILARLKLKTFKRSISSLVSEWKAHNKLFKLGLFKSHTKDVDLNEDETKLRLLGYMIINLFIGGNKK